MMLSHLHWSAIEWIQFTNQCISNTSVCPNVRRCLNRSTWVSYSANQRVVSLYLLIAASLE